MHDADADVDADVNAKRLCWMWMSDAIPNFHEHADDLCVIKSIQFEVIGTRNCQVGRVK